MFKKHLFQSYTVPQNFKTSIICVQLKSRKIGMSGRFSRFSSERLETELSRVDPKEEENRILLLTIYNHVPRVDNVDILHRICVADGKVEKIVMFERGSVLHGLVQFNNIVEAKNARYNTTCLCPVSHNSCSEIICMEPTSSLTVALSRQSSPSKRS